MFATKSHLSSQTDINHAHHHHNEDSGHDDDDPADHIEDHITGGEDGRYHTHTVNQHEDHQHDELHVDDLQHGDHPADHVKEDHLTVGKDGKVSTVRPHRRGSASVTISPQQFIGCHRFRRNHKKTLFTVQKCSQRLSLYNIFVKAYKLHYWLRQPLCNLNY